jgi:predicted negative regulator of RcsB-dependent stress response
MNKLIFISFFFSQNLLAQETTCNNAQVNKLIASKEITPQQVEYIDECLDGHPQKKEIALKLSFIEENILGTSKAQKKLQSRLDDESMWNSALFERLGDLANTVGNRSTAAESYRKAYRMDARNRKTLIKYVKQIEDKNLAVEFFEKNKIALNDQPEEMLMWAQTAYELGLSSQSENYVAQAFKINPKCYECLIIKAKIYLSSKRVDRAAEAVDLAVKLKGSSSADKTLLWLEAVTSFYLDRHDTALRDLELFKRNSYSHPYLAVMQAQIHAKREQSVEAKQYFNQAISFEGNFEDIHQAAAAYYFSHKDNEGLLNLFQQSPYSKTEWMEQYKYHLYEELGESSQMPSLDSVKSKKDLSLAFKIQYPLELTSERKIVTAASSSVATESDPDFIASAEIAAQIFPVQFSQSASGTGTTVNLDSAFGPGFSFDFHKGSHRANYTYATSDFNNIPVSTPTTSTITKTDISYEYYLNGLGSKRYGPLLGANWQRQTATKIAPTQLINNHEALQIKYGYFYQNKFKVVKNWKYLGQLTAGTPIYFNEGVSASGNLKYNFIFTLKNTISTRLQKNFLVSAGLNIEVSIAQFNGTGTKNISNTNLVERTISLPIGVIYEF